MLTDEIQHKSLNKDYKFCYFFSFYIKCYHSLLPRGQNFHPFHYSFRGVELYDKNKFSIQPPPFFYDAMSKK